MQYIKKKEKILKKEVALTLLATCLFITTFFMILSQSLDLSVFFVIWLISILIAIELINPSFLQPMYIKYAKYVILIGVLIFGSIVLNKIMEIIS